MPKLTLFPNGESLEISEEVNLLEALRSKGIYIKSSCGGVASCTDCIIKIRSGEDHLTAPPFEELALLGNVFHITKERLACQTRITGDVTVDISKHDKAQDEAKLESKTSSFQKSIHQTRVRKKDDVIKLKREREEQKEKRQENDDSWERHWEKESDPLKPKRMGGGRRPRPFKIDKGDNDES